MRPWTLRDAVIEALDRADTLPGLAREHPEAFLDVLAECGFTVTSEAPSVPAMWQATAGEQRAATLGFLHEQIRAHGDNQGNVSSQRNRDHWHMVWPEGEGHWCYKNGCVLDQPQNHSDDDAGVVVGGDRLDLDAIEARVKEAVDYDGYEGGRRAADVAREDAPLLIAEVRRLRSLLDDAGVAR